jgi:hypothetical protein
VRTPARRRPPAAATPTNAKPARTIDHVEASGTGIRLGAQDTPLNVVSAGAVASVEKGLSQYSLLTY